MPVQIEIPEPLADSLRKHAEQSHTSIEAIAIQAIERDLARLENSASKSQRVQLPLIRSKRPGSLRSLTGAEVDEILD